jgi:hypothetical protein
MNSNTSAWKNPEAEKAVYAPKTDLLSKKIRKVSEIHKMAEPFWGS